MQDRQLSWGFTLIELMIVIAIIAVIASSASPELIEARKSLNESAAIGALRTLTTAQSLFRDGDKDGDAVADYAVSIAELHLVNPPDLDPDEVDPNGVGGGYHYEVLGTVAPPLAAGFRAIAVPHSPASGNRTFAVDDTGLLVAAIGEVPDSTDEVIDAASGTSSCAAGACDGAPPVPIPTAAQLASFDEALRDTAKSAIQNLRALAPATEDPLPDAIALLEDPTATPAILTGLDSGSDSGLSFAELLDPDLLGAAQSLKSALVGSDTGPPIGTDTTLAAETEAYQDSVAALLELGAAGEDAAPAVPIALLTGDPLALLGSLLVAVPILTALGSFVLAATLAAALVRAGRTR